MERERREINEGESERTRIAKNAVEVAEMCWKLILWLEHASSASVNFIRGAIKSIPINFLARMAVTLEFEYLLNINAFPIYMHCEA